ncbi:nucleophosmin-like isoform X2 [Cynoglossus semilaevis]|uniref:Nucleophosmin-like n=1 Tax=Cynoglossus semilaevis TaxID=244447 RepID=A0A3P8WWH6_CYNSE|nr:nucleophosmin-like isoform X2 [Cynoglossus semilaevis]
MLLQTVIYGCVLEAGKAVTFNPKDSDHNYTLDLRMACVDTSTKDELHTVAVERQDTRGEKVETVLVSLQRSTLPSVFLGGFTITTPTVFRLKAGSGPIHISGQLLVEASTKRWMDFEDRLEVGFPCLAPDTELHTPVVPPGGASGCTTVDETPISGDAELFTSTVTEPTSGDEDTTDDLAPSQRSRGHSETTVAELQVSTGPPVSVSQALLDDGSEGGEQRELGVSEMASKDSEDLFKTAEDDAIDVQPEVIQEENAPPQALPTGQGSIESNRQLMQRTNEAIVKLQQALLEAVEDFRAYIKYKPEVQHPPTGRNVRRLYTEEEDGTILNFIKLQKNRQKWTWKDMEAILPKRTGNSIRLRYQRYLSHRIEDKVSTNK